MATNKFVLDMILRLLLGDQLNSNHSWYKDDTEACYFMAEMKQEMEYTTHHIQKVIAFFLSMRNFNRELEKKGLDTIYYTLDHPDNKQSLVQNLSRIIKEKNITKFEYQMPDEFRLDKQLKEFCDALSIPFEVYDTEHFLTTRNELSDFFKGKKLFVMEYFYRYMRKKYDIMMVTDKDPEGEQWNFDQNNRKKWNEKDQIPDALQYNHPVNDIVKMLNKMNVRTMGNVNVENFQWPVDRSESLDVLTYFCEHLLVHFGDYQDAMHTDQHFLFHSRLSFAMNSKMLHPKEVIDTVIAYWRAHQDEISIAQVEGFVRQIIGWREYMRGIYWMQMPGYSTKNELANANPLPDFFWTGKTKMNCLKHAINQSLDHAYAHHIQRLMITGNYALLTQTHPDEVDQWYLGVYIDAIEWVEITNTRGMSQFADGGIVATKPYVSSGSYINKMSNYCKGCHYKVAKKTESNACPFNSLYWNFLDEKRTYFKNNQRMSMMLRLLDKMDRNTLALHKTRAAHIIQNPNEY